MHFLMTNDVESFSIPLNKLDVDTAKEVYEVGLPRLLDLYARHDIKCTFYFTGTMCELVPGSIDLVKAHGHEIGCHSYSHAENKALDVSLKLLDEVLRSASEYGFEFVTANEYTKMYNIKTRGRRWKR